jgi:endonuclease YncB( thermonuclease family)
MNALTDGELRAYVTDDKTDANIWRVQAGLIGDI